MIKTNEPTNNEMDNNLPVSKYLRSFLRKIMSGKTIKVLLFIFVLTFLNIGAKFPARSEQPGPNNAEIVNDYVNSKNEAERYMKMYQEIYERSTIQQIEFESEVIIPEYFAFKYVEFVSQTAEQFGISRRMAFRLIYKESCFDDKVVSPVGARGLMQLMPDTRSTYYKQLRVDTLDFDKNQEDIYIGLYYLKDLREFWKKRGNPEKVLWKLSLAAYNAGPGKVIQYKGIPPYKQTIDFVAFINTNHSNPVFYANILNKNDKDVKDRS